jgi:hypothetical protein
LRERISYRKNFDSPGLFARTGDNVELWPWIKGIVAKDNWQTTAWQLSQAKQQAIPAHDEHT